MSMPSASLGAHREAVMDFAGTWHNQHGSVMDLEISDDGRVTGRFMSGVGLAELGEPFALAGFVAGDLISFTVDFGPRGSLTAWVGHGWLEHGVERIETLWQMAVELPLPGEQATLWRGTWAGADTFARAEPEARAARGLRPSHPVEDMYLGTP
jgi:hypothetical protein